MKTLLVCCLCLLGTSPCLADYSGFPTEEEMNARLHPNMTIQEVIAQFGEPGNQIGQRSDSCLFRYIAPSGLLTSEQEGYIGFEIHLVDGKVRDWRTFRARPSYEPMKAPPELRWAIKFWIIFFGCMFVYGTVRVFTREVGEKQAVLRAYKTRDIPTRRLPEEFRFITHDTTIQEVIDKLGPCSRLRKHVVGEHFADGYGFIEGPLGNPAIISFDYDLPYHAGVILLPEYPFESENRLRAAYYRPVRMDDDA